MGASSLGQVSRTESPAASKVLCPSGEEMRTDKDDRRLTYIHEFGKKIFDFINIFSHFDDVLFDCLVTSNANRRQP